MKKMFAMILAVSMLACLFSGCGDGAASTSAASTASSAETTTEVQDSAPAATPAAEQPAEASNQEGSLVEELQPGEMTQDEQLESMQNLVIENPYTFPLVP